MAAQVREASTSEEEWLFDRFIKAKVSKILYKSKTSCFISKELSLELSFSRQVISNSFKHAWEIHIVHLIPWSNNYNSYVDVYMYAASGFSLDLKLWWYVHWPEEIQSKPWNTSLSSLMTAPLENLSPSISLSMQLSSLITLLPLVSFPHYLPTPKILPCTFELVW